METLFGIPLDQLRSRYGLNSSSDCQKSKLNERSSLLEEIRTEVNNERLKTKFYLRNGIRVPLKPMTGAEIGVKLSHIPTSDLFYLKSISLDCKHRTGSFSKCLFGSIKPRNEIL